MFALDTVSRGLFAAAAFAAFGAAFVTTPLGAHGEGGAVADPTPAVAALPARTTFADVVPRRDPFAGGDPPAARASARPSPHMPMLPQIPMPPQIPGALRALPPNAGAGDAAFPFATGARSTAVVTAVITGPHPFALVDEAGTTRVLTVGDQIGGEAITAIGIDGVRLSNGATLPVAAASGSANPVSAPIAPSPAPRAPVPVASTLIHPIAGGR